MGKYIHSFAKVWLDRLGNEIYINDTNFFKENIESLRTKFKIKPLQTYIRMGEELIEKENISEITNISFPDMKKKFRLTIYRIPILPETEWRRNQKYILYIGKKQHGKADVPESTIRRRNSAGKCILEWDRLNHRVRGVGEDFGTSKGQFKGGDVTPWVNYSEKKKEGHNINILARHDSYEDISKLLYDKWKGVPIKAKKYMIKELPVMITEEGHLLCIPKTKVLPKILIVGKSGRGKSFTLNSLLGRFFYIFQYRVGLLNDSLDQFYDLMLPMKQNGFIAELNRIGNEPRHLPTINLYMSCPEMEMRYADERVSYRLVISLREFLNKWKYYTYGVGRWDLGKAQRYMTTNVINTLARCKTSKEAKDKLYNILPFARDEKKGDGIRSMIFKWESTLENIFRDNFTSNLFQNEETTSAEWILKNKEGEFKGHPFIISAYAGLVPVINNAMAKERPIASKQMSDLIRKIVEWQMRMKENKKPFVICIDELKDLLHKKGDDVYQALDYLFTQGRFPRIGFIGNIQEYTQLSKSMRANSTHLIIFELQTDEERKNIAKDYMLEKKRLDEIAELKTFQCLFTTKEKVVLYDNDGKRNKVWGGIWKGKVIPPLTCHLSQS